MCEFDSEDRRKHLDFLQLTITRMAANSFVLKGWTVTLVAALLALAAEKGRLTSGAWLALIPLFVMWGLDAFYVRQERLFRKLYEAVVEKDKDVPTYSMDTRKVKDKVTWWPTVAFSPTLWPFYLGLLAVAVVMAVLASSQPGSGATSLEEKDADVQRKAHSVPNSVSPPESKPGAGQGIPSKRQKGG